MQKMAELIKDIHSRNHLIHHRFHLRIEIDNLDAYEIAEEMIKNGKVHEISFMDHTPGQGQYRNLEIYRSTIAKYQGRDQDEIQMEQLLQEQMEKKTLSAAQMQQLTKMAQERKIAVASHDDDTEEKMALNREIGVTISEFPVTLAAARKAKDMGFQTVVGAPNIMREALTPAICPRRRRFWTGAPISCVPIIILRRSCTVSSICTRTTAFRFRRW